MSDGRCLIKKDANFASNPTDSSKLIISISFMSFNLETKYDKKIEFVVFVNKIYIS